MFNSTVSAIDPSSIAFHGTMTRTRSGPSPNSAASWRCASRPAAGCPGRLRRARAGSRRSTRWSAPPTPRATRPASSRGRASHRRSAATHRGRHRGRRPGVPPRGLTRGAGSWQSGAMDYLRIWADEDGVSHFTEVELPFEVLPAEPGVAELWWSEPVAVDRMHFLSVRDGNPVARLALRARRQFVTFLTGWVSGWSPATARSGCCPPAPRCWPRTWWAPATSPSTSRRPTSARRATGPGLSRGGVSGAHGRRLCGIPGLEVSVRGRRISR